MRRTIAAAPRQHPGVPVVLSLFAESRSGLRAMMAFRVNLCCFAMFRSLTPSPRHLPAAQPAAPTVSSPAGPAAFYRP